MGTLVGHPRVASAPNDARHPLRRVLFPAPASWVQGPHDAPQDGHRPHSRCSADTASREPATQDEWTPV